MSELLLHPSAPMPDGTILTVTPESAGWGHVGFEVLQISGDIAAERDCGERELCVVVIAGTVDIHSQHGDWLRVGGRADPWSGPPDAAYLPPRSRVTIMGSGEVALCWAPAGHGGARARVLRGNEIDKETRGYGSQERTVRPILMGDRQAEALLVCEVLTPGGNWSSYPPHKHDQDDPPAETLLEETYYHRLSPQQGFGMQRVYSKTEPPLDETLTFSDRDCVLVPRGYHTVSAPPGYDSYYLNVMAGPVRWWAVVNDPDHEWRLTPSPQA